MKTLRMACLILGAVSGLGLRGAYADTIALKDGTKYEGMVEKTETGFHVLTVDGEEFNVAAEGNPKITAKKTIVHEYSAKLKSADGKDVVALTEIAEWCLSKKALGLAAHCAKHILAIDSENRFARKLRGEFKIDGKWMKEAEAKKALGFVEYDGRLITPREAELLSLPCTKPEPSRERRDMEDQIELIQKEQKPTDEENHRARNLKSLRDSEYAVRALSARNLSQYEDDEVVDALAQCALEDGKDMVRLEATKSLKTIGQRTHRFMAKPFVSAIAREDAQVRMNALNAMGVLGEEWVVQPVMKTYRMVSGGGPGAHFFMGQDRAYVSGATPTVGGGVGGLVTPEISTMRTGIMLYAKVYRIDREVTVIEKKLVRRTVNDLGGPE